MSHDERRCITQAELLELAVGCNAAERACLMGLTGPPGAGKSTLAAHLTESLCPAPPVVSMDGFHLAQAVIEERGLTDRKGSPETFDGWGFINLVTRIANPAGGGVIYAPKFDRSIEEPIAGAIAVEPTDRLVIVEGNYLLLDELPWALVRPALDLCVYVDIDDTIRIRRLVDRHVWYGSTRLDAEHFVRTSDEKNAQLIKSTRNRADLIICPD